MSSATTSGLIRLLRAPNPGPMTLDGTNTLLLGDPELEPVVVVDPGPLIEGHLRSIIDAASSGIRAVVLTHRHADHSKAAAELASRAGCGVRAADPDFQVGPDGLVDGEQIQVGEVSLEVVATPGHTSDSCCLIVVAPDVVRLLSGDTVLGRGSTVITYPDGDLDAYLASLDRLEELVQERLISEILPGHGPVVAEPIRLLQSYRRHRLERLDQVRAAVRDGADDAEQVVSRVYADVDASLRPAAEQSVRAQLDYLRQHG